MSGSQQLYLVWSDLHSEAILLLMAAGSPRSPTACEYEPRGSVSVA